ELADRARAPHRHRVTGLYPGVFRSHPSRREDVGKEEHLFVAQVGVDADRTDVGVGYAEVLRLPTRKSTREVRVAEQTRGRMTHQLLRELRVPVRCLADGIEAVPARPAAAAGDRERDHDPVAGAQPLHAGTDLLDDAHRLMP